MKKLSFVLFGLVFVLSIQTGCQSPARPGSVEVVIEGGGEFPQFLVGKWWDEREWLGFTFERDGTISSAVTPIGWVTLRPGQKTVVPMKKGGKGVYVPGDWLVNYSPETRELTVKIVLEHFRNELGPNVVEGNSVDIYTGPVSEDGTQWEPFWFAYPTYYITTDIFKNHKLSGLPEDANPRRTMHFKKVTETE